MGKLSDVHIRNFMNAKKPIAVADGGGLTFTLSSKGTAAWVLRYRFGNRPRELTLGRYPDISLSDARKEATAYRAAIQKGHDVAKDRRHAKAETAVAKSFRELANDYMDKKFPQLALNTTKQRRYHIERIILPKIGMLPARDVTTSDIVALIETVGAKSHSVAELVLTAISEIFKHGVGRHAVQANPCAGISLSAICGQREPKRRRLKLTEVELRAIFPALPSIGKANELAVKILLATCVRIGELSRAEWSHIDFEKNEWFIPDANSKTGKGFTVPLVSMVAVWFKELKLLSCGSRYVLPARQQRRIKQKGGDTYFAQLAINSMLVKMCARMGDKVRRFSPHDLRSTARSHLAALGVDIMVAERCLNHSLGGLVAVYDQHDYMAERRAALELWTSFLLACETGREWTAPPSRRVA
jgi:integrase